MSNGLFWLIIMTGVLAVLALREIHIGLLAGRLRAIFKDLAHTGHKLEVIGKLNPRSGFGKFRR